MTYEAYRSLFIGGIIAAVLFAVVSVVLYKAFNVPYLMGYFSKKNRPKGVTALQKATDEYISNYHYNDLNNHAAGNNLDTPSALSTGSRKNNHVNGRTKRNKNGAFETTMLGRFAVSNDKKPINDDFVIEREITLIHTDEVIA